ncbi:ComEC/Rec2 family competence protein [Bartonella sp. B17]
MSSKNKVKNYLLKGKQLSSIWQDILSIFYKANYNEQSAFLFTSFKKAIIFCWEWLVDCIDKEVSAGLLFLLILVFFSTGIIFYFSLNREPSWRQFAVLSSVFFGILYILRISPSHRKIWFIVGFLCCTLLGALTAKIETWRMSTPMLNRDILTTLTGRIVSIEAMQKGEFRLILDVLSTEKPTLCHGPNRVRLLARHLPYGLAVGDGLSGRVKMLALSGPVRPGSYDFSFHNYFKGIGARGVYLRKPIKISVPQPDTILGIVLQKIENLRIKMTQKINMTIGGENGNIAAALITGQRGGISQDTNKALRTVGLAHILSISGLHMALLSSMAFISVRSFLALFPVFSSYYSTKKFAAIASLITTAFYFVLSGGSISAQRSFVMVAVMLVAVLCNRFALTMRNFALAGLITLAIAPHEILSPSFQMSFSATAALIAFFDWWNERLSFRRKKTTPSYIGGKVIHFASLSIILICVSSLVAGSASGIYAAYHFSNISLLSVISNVLVLPIVSIFIIPFGLIATLAMPLGIEWFPLQAMGFGIGLVIKIAHTISAISPALNPGFIPLSALVLFSVGLIGLTFFKTPIRFVFSLFILIGIYVCWINPSIQLIITDNMKLVGVINGKKLYTDHYYVPRFTASIWKKSFNVSEFIKPTKYGPPFKEQFICNDHVCTSRLENGLKVVVLRKKTDKCIKADIVIKRSTMSNRNCNKETQTIFTSEQLLSRGSVMINKNGDIIWSSRGFFRPWNMHRQHS